METETYPDIVRTFYSDCQVVDISKDKSNLKGNCKRCKKTITGRWKLAKVTSNFISHVKVGIMYNHKSFSIARLVQLNWLYLTIDILANHLYDLG
jgi:hypothetical protein